jgi:hypothetical protein
MKLSIAVLLGLSLTCQAEESVDTLYPKLDRYHQKVTNFVLDKTHSLDKYIANMKGDMVLENESYATLSLGGKYSRFGSFKTQSEFKLKVDLPYSKARWNFFLETNSSDFDALEDKDKDAFLSERSVLRDYDQGAVGFLFSDTTGDWQHRIKTGVRLDAPINAFTKYTLSKTKRFSDRDYGYMAQEIFYYQDQGFGYTSRLDFYRFSESGKYVYRSSTVGQYLNDDTNFELVKKFSASRMLPNDAMMRYTIGWTFNSKPSFDVDNYWINGNYRKKIYKDWLYLNIVTEVSFEKEDDFQANPSILFQIEGVFASDPLRHADFHLFN